MRRAGWLPALAVFAAGGALSLLHGDVGWDSTWVLQVVSRLRAGEVLYRDVFAGVPPLTFDLVRAATGIFGVELAVLKLLVAATLAVSWVAGARILQRVTGSSRLDWPLAAALIACALPDVASLYQPLANMFLLIAVAAATGRDATDRRSGAAWRAPVVAGAACALAMLAKQTIGVYAALAVVAILIGTRAEGAGAILRRLAAAAVSGIVVGIAFLAPVVWSGAWPAFLDYAFEAKTTYVRVGGVPYLDELRTWLASIGSGGLSAVTSVTNGLAFAVPLLAVLALVALIWWRRSSPTWLAVVLPLALAEFAGLYPRMDLQHVIPVVPGLLVTVGCAWDVTRRSRPRLAGVTRGIAAVVILLALAVRGAAAAAAVVDPERMVSSMPHLRGLVMRRAHLQELERDARALREAAAQDPLFLMIPNAGLYYLVSGVRNPTPFDYPLVTAFGRTGMTDTMARLERGDLRQVCLTHVSGLLTPEPLQSYIETHLRRAANLGVCQVYSR